MCIKKPGFPPVMLERGGSKRGGRGLGVLIKNQNFKFECLKWPILAEMTAKSGIYFHFLCQQGGISPIVVLRGGGGGGPDPPPRGNPESHSVV